MPKWTINYTEYKKVLESDLASLTDMLMEAKHYDKMVDAYMDRANVADEHLESMIKDDMSDAMTSNNIVLYLELNAFLGTLKKMRVKALRKKKK